MAQERYRSGKGQPSAGNEGTTVGQDELAQQLSEVSRSLQAQDDTDQMLDEVVRAAVALIPGVDEGSISVVTVAQTSPRRARRAICRGELMRSRQSWGKVRAWTPSSSTRPFRCPTWRTNSGGHGSPQRRRRQVRPACCPFSCMWRRTI